MVFLRNAVFYGCGFVACLCAATVNGANEDAEQGTVISDLSTIAAKLKQMRDVARSQEKLFENLSVKGRFDPGGELFTLVIRDGKCRHDRDVIQSNGQRVTSYWLDDGKTFFSISKDLLVMHPTHGDRATLADDIAVHFWLFSMPDFDGTRMSVSKYCDALLGLVLDGKTFGNNSPWTLRLREASDHTAIAIEARASIVFRRTALTLDSNKNYVMTQYSDWEASPQGPHVSLREEDICCEYREIAPGTLFLSKGRWWQKFSGRRLQDLKQAREWTLDVVVDSVEFGDFDVDATLFDIHHWPPIKHGITVYDARVRPAAEFVYAKGPFDKEVLENSAFQGRVQLYNTGTQGRNWILGVNVVALVVLSVAFFYRRYRRHSRAS